MERTFEIIPKDWYKRRSKTGEQVRAVHVEIPDYLATHNHICNMVVRYSDNTTKTLIARVIYNSLSEKWTVDGMEVSVVVVEECQSNMIEQHDQQQTL